MKQGGNVSFDQIFVVVVVVSHAVFHVVGRSGLPVECLCAHLCHVE